MKQADDFIIPASAGERPAGTAAERPVTSRAADAEPAAPPAVIASAQARFGFAELAESLRVMLGAEPRRREKAEWTPAMREIQEWKNTPAQRKFRRELLYKHESAKPTFAWRTWRWPSIILVNLLFVVSFHLDVQLVEGALTASRFVGFHLADLNSSLQVVLAYKELLINLLIGTVTVALLWWLVGGRSFCAWACPYHLLSEIAEMLHLWLAERGLAIDQPLDRRLRTVLYVLFALLALVTGYTVFETISPVGIVSRALIYGGGIALAWVGLLLLIEIFLVRRFWCRYVCPIGLTYGFVGATAPVKIEYDASKCLHEGNCRAVCLVPHVLEFTIKNRAHDARIEVGADCTRCAMCLEACLPGALRFKVKGVEKLL
jgi:ferredoxin-type protein NapH